MCWREEIYNGIACQGWTLGGLNKFIDKIYATSSFAWGLGVGHACTERTERLAATSSIADWFYQDDASCDAYFEYKLSMFGPLARLWLLYEHASIWTFYKNSHYWLFWSWPPFSFPVRCARSCPNYIKQYIIQRLYYRPVARWSSG